MPLSTGALPSIVSSVVSGYRVQTPVSPYSHDFIVAYTQVLLTQPEASTVYEHPISSTPQPRSAWSLLDTVAQNTDGNHHMARNFLHPRHASLGGQMTSPPTYHIQDNYEPSTQLCHGLFHSSGHDCFPVSMYLMRLS